MWRRKEMKINRNISRGAITWLHPVARQSIAVALSCLLLPFTQMELLAQEPPPGAYVPLGAVQLNQMVAPIALYPDSLVAQVLTASTYPQQVTEANNYVSQSRGMPPQQLAESVN